MVTDIAEQLASLDSTNLRGEVEQVLQRHTKVHSFLRSDPIRDAQAKVKDRVVSNDIVLPDMTKKFLKAIKYEIPKDGRVIFKNIPLFASPGDGKTVSALTMCFHLIKHYGSDKVAVYVSDHLPSLVDALRAKSKPVIILLVDDALKNYSSRGGGNTELLEAISLFTTLRHEYEAAHNTLNGIVFTIFTSQMYKGLDKVFREGFPIFKSALVSDKEEIMSATHMGKHAWLWLEEILRDVHVNHKANRMNDSLVILPGYPAGRLVLEPLVKDPFLDKMLEEIGTEAALEVMGEKAWAPKYKQIEKHWTIQRSRLSPEQAMARLNREMDRYAMQFATNNEDDTSTTDGKAALREWLENRVYNLGVPEDLRVPSEDYLKIKEPKNFKAFAEKVARARQKMAVKTIAGEGYELDGGRLTDNALMDYVARWFINEHNFDPYASEDRDRYQSLLYKLPAEVRNQAIKLKTPIMSRIKEVYVGAHGVPSKKKNAEAAEALTTELAGKVVDLEGEQFHLNPKELAESLIERARVNQDDKAYRDLMVFKACKWLDKWGGRTLGNPTDIAGTEEGQAWQVEHFGKAYSRPQMSKAKTAGMAFFANQVGMLFEVWVEEKLKAGYTVPGVFDLKPIADVVRGGGNESQPDLVIVYNDGTKDYVSLKCYTSQDAISITTNTRKGKSDEIQPERFALLQDEREGIEGNRCIVMLRNLYYDGFLAVRTFQHTRDIPETMGFNQADVGQWAFVERGTIRDDDAEEE